MTFNDPAHGWMAGDTVTSGVILATANSGGTWSPQSPGAPATLRAVAFSDASARLDRRRERRRRRHPRHRGWRRHLESAEPGIRLQDRASHRRRLQRRAARVGRGRLGLHPRHHGRRRHLERAGARGPRKPSRASPSATACMAGRWAGTARSSPPRAAASLRRRRRLRITKLKPASGKRGALVTITGIRFGAKTSAAFVKFGGAKCVKYTSWKAAQITCKSARDGEVRHGEGHRDDRRGDEQLLQLHGEAIGRIRGVGAARAFSRRSARRRRSPP